jgi:monofunctional glycosyltransferase
MAELPLLALDTDDRRPARRRRERPRRSWSWALIRAIGLAALGLALLSLLLVLFFARFDPPCSMVMLGDRMAAWQRADSGWRMRQRWVDFRDIPEALPLAVVAAEDQRFPSHRGFDFAELTAAWRKHASTGRPLRGASTLTQQVAKNLFLWRGRSYLRKGLEAWFTVLMELTWSKRRILEVYLNLAELGPGVYGVAAASETLLGRPLARLSAADAALMAAALPNPIEFRIDAPGQQLRERQRWVLGQMRQLGRDYLQGL